MRGRDLAAREGALAELRAKDEKWFALVMDIGGASGVWRHLPRRERPHLGKLPSVESRPGLSRIADSLCEYNESDAQDAARYRWLRHAVGYTIRCEPVRGRARSVDAHELTQKDADRCAAGCADDAQRIEQEIQGLTGRDATTD